MKIKEMSVRRLARQYAVEHMHECQYCGSAPEGVTAECVLERMESDGIPVREFDWGKMLDFVMRVLELLRPLFGPVPVASDPPAEKPAKK